MVYLVPKHPSDSRGGRSSVGFALRHAVALIQLNKRYDTKTGGSPMNQAVAFMLLFISTLTLSGCEIVGNIFEAGVWVGVILVVVIIGFIVWLFTRLRT